jgi:hypothetical protein
MEMKLCPLSNRQGIPVKKEKFKMPMEEQIKIER